MQINSVVLYLLSSVFVMIDGVETLQSKIDFNQTKLQTTTKAPWPKFELDSNHLSGSEEFSLHRPTSIGPSTSKPPAIKTEETQKYIRYSLPFQKSDQINVTHHVSSRRISENIKRPKFFQSSDLVKVSMPKIYVNMAFTGHYSKISVPRKRIR